MTTAWAECERRDNDVFIAAISEIWPGLTSEEQSDLDWEEPV